MKLKEETNGTNTSNVWSAVAAVLFGMYKEVSEREYRLNNAGKTELDYKLDDFFKDIGEGSSDRFY